MRAGAHALSLLAAPLNVQIVRALKEEPKSPIDLRRLVGSPPQTTIRGHLRNLSALGVLDRHRRPGFPGPIDYALAPPGAELASLADLLDAWLAMAPDGPLALGSAPAKNAIKAFVEGWSSTMVRAIAARPLALTELDRLIAGVNYPSLERRLVAMRLAGQIRACPGSSRSTPYAPTTWLRQSVGPLMAAARWERLFAPGDAVPPMGRLDVEAAFLLAVPLVRLSPERSGVCRLAVELPGRSGDAPVGVQVGLREGRVTSCVARLGGDAAAWVVGSWSGWLDVLMGGDSNGLEVGGDGALALELLEDLFTQISPPIGQCAR